MNSFQRDIMRRPVFILALLSALIAAPSGTRATESAQKLADHCQSVERSSRGAGDEIKIPFTKDALLCWGYMQAMQDASVLVDEDGQRLLGACPPEATTLLQLIRSFVSYARSNPAVLAGNSAVAVIGALQHDFPCPEIDRSAERSKGKGQ